MTIKELNTRMQKIDLAKLSQDAVRLNLEYIAEVNRLQLRKGEKGNGGQVGKYSPGYGAYKQKLSSYYAPSGVPDLYLTGRFHKSIKATLTGLQYVVSADDPNNLEGRYGVTIFGLNKGHTPLVMARVTRSMGVIFKQQTGL